MALTSTEEALVRQLLDQQAAILSLAGNEATITSKLGATKVTLSDLVSASAVADADLLLMRQGTNDKSVTPLLLKGYAQDGMASQKGVQAGDYNTSVAAGTADAITGDYTPNVLALEDGLTLLVRATAANATTTPTFSPDGLIAKTIVKGAGTALSAGDIAGAGHWLVLVFNSVLDKWILVNPFIQIQIASAAEAQAQSDNTKAITPLRLKEALQGTNQSLGVNGYQKLPGGLIIQWGLCTEGGTTLPIAFPNAFRAVNVTYSIAGNQPIGNTVTITGLSSFTYQFGAASTDQGYFIAIGY